MGYAVLHLLKPKGASTAMSAHIERTVLPANADPERTHLNRELVKFADGVTSRTEAIKHRLDTAGLKRKIGKNQVTDFSIVLSGTPKDMDKIVQQGKLNDWCNDNVDWLNKTYGAENVVSAVLHLDEKTPHIHATVVPIVTTERKRRKREEQVKKNYRKKPSKTPRLCVDEVMSRDKLKEYQDTYANVMARYGLQRGIEGSEARHITTNQFYREIFHQTEVAKENLSKLEQQQSEAQEQLSKVKSDISKEKLKNSAADVGSKLMDGVSSLLGTPKMAKVELENRELKELVVGLKAKNDYIYKGLESAKQAALGEIENLNTQFRKREQELLSENKTLKDEINHIFDLFPHIKELLNFEKFCRAVGFGVEMIKRMLKGESVSFYGEIYSHEYQRRYKTDGSIAKVEPDPDRKGKYRLNIDGKEIYDWFRQKQKEFLQRFGVNPPERKQNKGNKIH